MVTTIGGMRIARATTIKRISSSIIVKNRLPVTFWVKPVIMMPKKPASFNT